MTTMLDLVVLYNFVNKNCDTGEMLFWSEYHGWTELEKADIHKQSETTGIVLPGNAGWKMLSESARQVCISRLYHAEHI